MSAKLVSFQCESVPSNIYSCIGKHPREIEIATPSSVRREMRLSGRFLKGPIPMKALWKAACLPGQALAMYLAVRHQADLTRKPIVRVPRSLLHEFGIDKDSKSRSLRALEAAGLIRVMQLPGHSAQIEIVG